MFNDDDNVNYIHDDVEFSFKIFLYKYHSETKLISKFRVLLFKL